MEAKIFRIGNLVKYNDEIVEIISLWANGNFEVHSDILQFWHCDKDDDCVTGIDLTEEWLVKLGFKKTTKEKKYFATDYVFVTDDLIGFKITLRGIAALYGNDTSWTVISHESSFEPHVIKMDYVHQLQNLIQAISYKSLQFEL